eukprot:199374_1
MALNAAFVNKLQYLLTVGYTNEVINAFTGYCQDQGFDLDTVEDDLETIQESSIVDHLQEIYDWNGKKANDFYSKLRQSLDIDPKPAKPSAHQIDYALSSSELEIYKKTYLEQCPALLPMQQIGDEALLRVLAIGRKNGICLLQNIADTFCRARINAFVKKRHDLKEPQFTSNYHLLKEMTTQNERKNAQYLDSALQSFHKRICPKLQFTNLMFKMKDHLPDYFEYTAALIKFIHKVVRFENSRRDALPPFQIDYWIIPSDVSSVMACSYPDPEDDEEDEDNEDEDEAKERVERIGDIEARLQHEKLTYHKHKNPVQRDRFARHLDKTIKDFWMDNRNQMNKKKKEKKAFEHDRSGAHRTRINVITDRRKPKEEEAKTWRDTMFIFAPPNDCNSIGDNHCPEWYLNASKTIVLPGKGYNNGQRIKSQAESKSKEDCEDIDASKPVGGYQFTLSFHVEAANDIKCYCYYQGWIGRFFPQDMVNVWPLWFDQSKQNKEFIDDPKNWKSRISELRHLLCDDQFENWYKDSTKRDDLFYTC